MRKRILKKSEVLREGYIKGLKKAQRIINEMLVYGSGFDDDMYINDYAKMYPLDDINKKFLDGILDSEVTYEALDELIANGADVNAKDGYGMTPLMHAVSTEFDSDTVRYLLEKGADVNEQDLKGNTALMHAIYSDRSLSFEDILASEKADTGIKNNKGETVYDLASANGNPVYLEILQDYDKF